MTDHQQPNELLPPAYVVRREGTVFTGMCLSRGRRGYPLTSGPRSFPWGRGTLISGPRSFPGGGLPPSPVTGSVQSPVPGATGGGEGEGERRGEGEVLLSPPPGTVHAMGGYARGGTPLTVMHDDFLVTYVLLSEAVHKLLFLKWTKVTVRSLVHF